MRVRGVLAALGPPMGYLLVWFLATTDGWSFSNRGNHHTREHPHQNNGRFDRRDFLSTTKTLVTITAVVAVVPAAAEASGASVAFESTSGDVTDASNTPGGGETPQHDSPKEESSTEAQQQQQEQEQELRQRLLERRQLMEASRSSNNRQSYLDLSRQRAALYNTKPKAVSCPTNGIPCF